MKEFKQAMGWLWDGTAVSFMCSKHDDVWYPKRSSSLLAECDKAILEDGTILKDRYHNYDEGPLVFHVEDSFYIKDRGWVFTTKLDKEYWDPDYYFLGKMVRIIYNESEFIIKVVGVELFRHAPPFRKDEPCGLLAGKISGP